MEKSTFVELAKEWLIDNSEDLSREQTNAVLDFASYLDAGLKEIKRAD